MNQHLLFLAICGLEFAAITFFLQNSFQPNTSISLKDKLATLDLQGSTILTGASVYLIIALQFGGVIHPWGDSSLGLPLGLRVTYHCLHRLGMASWGE